MKKIKWVVACFVLALMAVPPVFAQDPIIYPNKGQSSEQQEKDKFDCYTWAKGQTGFDPMQVPTATTAPPQEGAQQGGVVRGAGRGAPAGTGYCHQRRREHGCHGRGGDRAEILIPRHGQRPRTYDPNESGTGGGRHQRGHRHGA